MKDSLRQSAFLVRPALRPEMNRWRSLMRQHHYLGFECIVGKSLCYIATCADQWVALIGWGSAAFQCAARDKWIGWQRSLQFKRLHLIANNVRFLILPDWHIPNLASHLLALNLKRLSHDWQNRHGHPILLAETFVDSTRFAGTCYRAAGWKVLGTTRGYSKCNKRYFHNGQPKLLLVRPLVADARSCLRAAFLPPIGAPAKEHTPMIDINRLPLQGQGGLMDMLQTVVDPRKPRGVRHPVATVVAIAICATLSGARSFTAIAEWAQALDHEALRKLGAKRRSPPSEPTIRRVLQRLNADLLDTQIGTWLTRHCSLAGSAVAVDGKTVRGAHGFGQQAVHLLSAIVHDQAVVIGQIAVEEKTNEIPKLPELLGPVPLQGAVVTADAMHTQRETARYLVEDKHADYLLVVKDNQPSLRKDIADLNFGAFPP
jgi:hypothetical protein